jgi:hypothetical protein
VSKQRRVAASVALAGLAVSLFYVVSALASGGLSHFDRGPLLDGLGPSQPYRWVSAPAYLAATNVAPSEGEFSLQMGPNGNLGLVLVTSDNQATVVVDNGTFPPHGADRSVKFLVLPEDPSKLSPPPGTGVVTFGNAYRFSALYEPSGTPIAAPAKPFDVILAHPVTRILKPTTLDIYGSPNGSSWMKLDSKDSAVAQQVEAPGVSSFGYLQVAGVPAPLPISTSSSASSHALVIAIGVGALCLLLIGVGVLIRSRRSSA